MAAWLLSVLGACAHDVRAHAPRVPAASAASVPTTLDYSFRIDPALETVEARVCFAGSVPSALRPGAPWASDYLRKAFTTTERGSRDLGVRDQRIVLEGLSPGSCASYTVDVSAAAQSYRGLDASRHGDAILTNTALWLWRPEPRFPIARATARFELPEGMRASLPWPRRGDDYLLDRSAFIYYAFAVFGRFEVEEVPAPGATLQVAILPGVPVETRANVVPWLERASRAVSEPFGRFPRSAALVVVVPSGPIDEPVRFGSTNRGGGASFAMLLPTNAELEPLLHDWVAVHEFSHLFHPFVDRDDAWFSEGLATYYQEIVRARAGMEPAPDAWRRLYEGARLGRHAAQSLSEESHGMFERMSFRMVYWAGASFALMADVELRRRTQGRLTLDRVMYELSRQSESEPPPMRAREVVERLDRIVGQPVFSDLMRRWVDGPSLPSLDSLYERLGLRVEDGHVQTLGEAPEAWIRDAIMSGGREQVPPASGVTR